MSLRGQLIKCTLYVILYIIVCFLLLKLRQNFIVHQSDTIIYINANQTKQECLPKIIRKPVNREIKLLERDEMTGQSINLQKSAALLHQVSTVCAKNNLKTPLIKRHFLYSSKHKSLYCWIRKVASTSFTKLFSDMQNRQTTRDNYYREVDYLTTRNLKELQFIVNDPSTFKLLVVRHPFQRLVSSYRDRIEDNTKRTSQAWIYAKKIFHLTRPELFHSNTTTGNIMQKIFTRDKRLKLVPSFKEFSEWLLKRFNEDDDVHWNSYYTHCAVCNVSYNYILKLDDYTYGEVNYIFSKFGLDKNKVYLPELEKTTGGYTDFDTTCKYFSTLTRQVVFQLYERYKIDFEMYNYNLQKYMYCAKS